VSEGDSPFIDYDWLHTLGRIYLPKLIPQNMFLLGLYFSCIEDAKCASANRGWQPLHLAVYKDDELAALSPMYRNIA